MPHPQSGNNQLPISTSLLQSKTSGPEAISCSLTLNKAITRKKSTVQVAGKSHYFLVTVKAAVCVPVRTCYFLPCLSTSHLCFPEFIINSPSPAAAIDGEMLMRAAIAECLCRAVGFLSLSNSARAKALSDPQNRHHSFAAGFLAGTCCWHNSPACLVASNVIFVYFKVCCSSCSFQDMLVKGPGKHISAIWKLIFAVFYICKIHRHVTDLVRIFYM